MSGSEDRTETIHERIGSISESMRHLKDRTGDLESRMRHIETKEMDSLKDLLRKMESRVSAFDSETSDSKQKWGIALNFFVQLMWVVTASFVLAKLGLQVGGSP